MFSPPRLRLALGLGDQELEWRLRPALDADDDELAVVAQCLSADQVLQAIEAQQVDALVVAWGLHRLSEALLEQLERTRLPLLLLVPDPEHERWQARRGPVLPLDADARTVRAAILAASRGERFRPTRAAPAPESAPRKAAAGPAAESSPQPLSIIAVAGGAGSPGRTTVAANLAVALGAAVPTVLVDADFSAPTLAAVLDRDPSRNVCTLAHVVRESPHAWGQALADELQPLHRHVPRAAILCGLPKREMRSSISPGLLERLVAELSSRFRFVILDVGEELLGTDAAAVGHRAALAVAQHLLVVTATDLIGLWHVRTALKQFERHLGLGADHVSLVLNRHDLHHHHTPLEIEWHLGTGVAGVVPYDYAAAQRAVAEQRPLVLDPTSRAGRALVRLAERLHHGQLHMPAAEHSVDSRPWWRRSWPRGRPTGSPDGRSSALGGSPSKGERRGRVW